MAFNKNKYLLLIIIKKKNRIKYCLWFKKIYIYIIIIMLKIKIRINYYLLCKI